MVFGRTLLERDVRTLSDLLLVPRYTASFDLTDTQTLLLGASAAFGPNGTGDRGQTHLYGLDAFWKWKSSHADKGFPFVKVQAEGMTRAYRAAANGTSSEETFRDWGSYAQVVWGFKPRWLAGIRYDEVGGDVGDPPGDPALASRWRASTNVTWFPTEYSKLRLQYNRDELARSTNAGSLWLQLEFLLGAHAAHKF